MAKELTVRKIENGHLVSYYDDNDSCENVTTYCERLSDVYIAIDLAFNPPLARPTD